MLGGGLIEITRKYNLAFVFLGVYLISFEDSDKDFDVRLDFSFRLDNIIVQTDVYSVAQYCR